MSTIAIIEYTKHTEKKTHTTTALKSSLKSLTATKHIPITNVRIKITGSKICDFKFNIGVLLFNSSRCLPEW